MSVQAQTVLWLFSGLFLIAGFIGLLPRDFKLADNQKFAATLYIIGCILLAIIYTWR